MHSFCNVLDSKSCVFVDMLYLYCEVWSLQKVLIVVSAVGLLFRNICVYSITAYSYVDADVDADVDVDTEMTKETASSPVSLNCFPLDTHLMMSMLMLTLILLMNMMYCYTYRKEEEVALEEVCAC